MGERIATASVRTGLAMTWYLQGVQCAAGHMGPTPQLSILQGRARVPCRECGKNSGRAVEDAGPYGSATRGAMGGRPQGSPLRKGLYGGLKTKSSPAFAKDDALHRGTTLLRGLLTQAAL